MPDFNNINLADLHVVITGGSRGIGAAIADKFNELGSSITLMGRSEDALKRKLADLEKACYVTMDVTEPGEVEQAFKQAVSEMGEINILVNNAGAAMSAPLAKTTDDDWQQMLDINLTGSFYCTRQVIPVMQRNNWGRIINIASTAGLKGYAYVSAYSAAKHGIIGMTRSLSLEFANTGITVNAVCPGYTNTDLLGNAIENIMDKTGVSREDAEQALKQSNPQNRFIQPEEVASVVAWLCSPGSESITGQAIPVAGGEIM